MISEAIQEGMMESWRCGEVRLGGTAAWWRWTAGMTIAGLASLWALEVLAAEAAKPTEKPGLALQNGEHPLDAALEIARDGLRHIDANVRDYTATLIKRERVSGELLEYQSLDVKIRHRRTAGEKTVTPFSVYLRFVAPQSVAGREVIWVEGRNEGKLVAHDAGLKNFLRVRLDPTGFVAMLGNRYPITKIGLRNLVEELITKGEIERERGEIEVQFFDNAKVDGRPCRMIQITHPVKRPYFEFYRCRSSSTGS